MSKKTTDGRLNNHGVYGHDGSNAGRPSLHPGKKRKMRSLRATDEEWKLIKVYVNQIKNNSNAD